MHLDDVVVWPYSLQILNILIFFYKILYKKEDEVICTAMVVYKSAGEVIPGLKGIDLKISEEEKVKPILFMIMICITNAIYYTYNAIYCE